MVAGPGALRDTITEKFLRASRVAATCREKEKSAVRVEPEEGIPAVAGLTAEEEVVVEESDGGMAESKT